MTTFALPARHLCGPKPAKYRKADHTDIRRTFRKARLLAFLRRHSLGENK